MHRITAEPVQQVQHHHPGIGRIAGAEILISKIRRQQCSGDGMHRITAEMNEVVVTGLSKAAEKNRTPTPITTVPAIQLLQNSSTNIIDALATQPGVSQVTTGSGISKPVIRG